MRNSMKKVIENDETDIFEVATTKYDIVSIYLLENAKIIHKKTNKEYFNSNFLVITNRKGVSRVLDLDSQLDITNILSNFEITYDNKEEIFKGQ